MSTGLVDEYGVRLGGVGFLGIPPEVLKYRLPFLENWYGVIVRGRGKGGSSHMGVYIIHMGG